MRALVNILGGLLDFAAGFVGGAASAGGLLVASAVMGLAAVAAMKVLTPQERIRKARRLIKARFLEIRLYSEDFRAILAAQRGILAANLRYLSYNVPAFLPLAALFILSIAAMGVRAGHEPLLPGEQIELAATLSAAADACPDPELETPPGLAVLAGGLRFGGEATVSWQLSADAPGRYPVTLRACGREAVKEVVVGEGTWSPTLRAEGFAAALYNPLETPLPRNGAIERIEVAVRGRTIPLLPGGRMRVHWLVFYTLASIAFGLVFKKLLKVH